MYLFPIDKPRSETFWVDWIAFQSGTSIFFMFFSSGRLYPLNFPESVTSGGSKLQREECA